MHSQGGQLSFANITEAVKETIARANIKSGICVVYTHHTTCSVVTQEEAYDVAYSGLEFLQQDLADVMERWIPTCRKEGQYMHPGPKATVFAAENGESKSEALNTDGHLRSSIIGRSESLVVTEGQPDLGTFGQIYFIDFDQTRARERQVQICVLGE